MKDPTDNNNTLNLLHTGGYIARDIMADLGRSEHFQKTFKVYFFKFVDALSLSLNLPLERHAAIAMMFDLSLGVAKTPDVFVNTFMLEELKESDRKDEYLALFQNAFIYALAGCYKSQIKSNYMRASERTRLSDAEATELMITGKARGAHLAASPDDRAQYPDSEYVKHIEATHPLFATFVRSKHRFQSKKILAVAGYIINPSLKEV